MAASLTTPIGPGSPSKQLRFNTADKLNVEIFIAGDGEHYPRKGQTVEVHYTAYVSRAPGRALRLYRVRLRELPDPRPTSPAARSSGQAALYCETRDWPALLLASLPAAGRREAI